MTLTVVEVISRSAEGRTQPYICRCDDGDVYFVKGRSATRPGLIAEWLCAQLGKAFGLPLAESEIAIVPQELIEADLTGWLADLGTGEVFASRRVNAINLTETHRPLVPLAERRDVLAFDWWVHNGDRTLTAMGGNANLLWNPTDEGKLVVIDHNLAFEPGFSAENYCSLHVFAEDIPAMFSDFLLRDAYLARFEGAIGVWEASCASLPESWSFIDPEQTIPVNFPFAAVKDLLDRAFTDIFWQLPL
jgi:hypothetical protein